MSVNTMSLSASDLDIKAVVMADSTPAPAYEYKGGKRTDSQRVNPEGWAIYALRDVSASIAGEAATIRLEMGNDEAIPAGSILVPSGPATATVRAQAVSSSYATLAISISAEHWEVRGNALSALGITASQSSSDSDFDEK
ncbi:hypothetical protein GWO60_08925 [Corynebacterium macginleyi]|uniref:DUF2190 family protein n=1 Tax=Corynebacterium macginleyi TaxID=38290 RepID=A0ABS1Y7T4_9CORY|nr:hypothetical protein [Corynebacterium macginleyi]MBK4174628.1 hypothetical protein [Corynebacterium macginleyi]MBM0244458.1 hypothetical protein [Corynebacterium macginleyi]